MKIIKFWISILIIAFDILPLCYWVIYDYNGIDVTVSNIGFFQEIDIPHYTFDSLTNTTFPILFIY